MRLTPSPTRAYERTVVFVVGMHRSGTSAMTRLLTALGVELGNNHLDAIPGVNEKGFWEDRDFNRLNIALLEQLGSEWFKNSSVPPTALSALVNSSLAESAREFLRNFPGAGRTFALKDPRTSLLLPFWRKICAEIALESRFVIALRNPLSVSDSIQRRNGFDPRKNAYLWLRYTLAALLQSRGAPRVVVAYESLLDDPLRELRRIAERLHLPTQGLSRDDGFVGDFLAKSLCHARHAEAQVQCDASVPRLVRELYPLASKMAADRLDADSPVASASVESVAGRYDELESLFAYLDELEMQSPQFRRFLGLAPETGD